MARKSILDTLPSADEPTPVGVEIVKPDENYALQVERESREASRRAELRARGIMPTEEPAIEVLPNAPSLPQPVDPPAFTPLAESVMTPDAVRDAASTLLNYLMSLSWDWHNKCEATMQERGFSPAQLFLHLAANTLDSGAHMTMPPDHPFFQNGFTSGGSSFVCVECGEAGTRLYAGQPPLHADGESGRFCSRLFRQRPQEDQQERLTQCV